MFEKEDLNNKRVFVRADLNVPLRNGTISDDQRLRAFKVTLDALLKRGAIIILGTHLGRPKKPSADLSTQLLIPWFSQQGYRIEFLSDIKNLQKLLVEKKPDIVLLENLRFYPGEQSDNKHIQHEFGKQLAQLAPYYINDAFGLLHRHDTSITVLPNLYNPTNRALGLVINKERTSLEPFRRSTNRSFLLIIGGNKFSSKLPFIQELLDTVTTIAWCPAPVFTLIKSQGGSTGRSYIENTAIVKAQNLLKLARKKNVTCLFPVDYQVRYGDLTSPLTYITATEIPPTAQGIAIGPETVNEYCKHINKAKLVVYNGLMGMLDHPETLTAVHKLFTAMAQSNALSIIAGGDSVAAAKQLHVKGIDYLSTGGGATLAYLSGKALPGLSAFDHA